MQAEPCYGLNVTMPFAKGKEPHPNPLWQPKKGKPNPFKPKTCAVAGCGRIAMYPMGKPVYCGQHQIWAQAAKSEPKPVYAEHRVIDSEWPAREPRKLWGHLSDGEPMEGQQAQPAVAVSRALPSAMPLLMLPAPAPVLLLAPLSSAATPGERLAYKSRQLSSCGPALREDRILNVLGSARETLRARNYGNFINV